MDAKTRRQVARALRAAAHVLDAETGSLEPGDVIYLEGIPFTVKKDLSMPGRPDIKLVSSLKALKALNQKVGGLKFKTDFQRNSRPKDRLDMLIDDEVPSTLAEVMSERHGRGWKRPLFYLRTYRGPGAPKDGQFRLHLGPRRAWTYHSQPLKVSRTP